MSIRKSRKDHLAESARVAEVVADGSGLSGTSERAATSNFDADRVTHEASNPHLVFALSGKAFDFGCLFKGVNASTGAKLSGFGGRPDLASEILPALRELASTRADLTVKQMRTALRFFWRSFHEMEARASGMPRLVSVRELTAVHRQAVVDRKISPQSFSQVLTVLNLTRLALGEKQLAWPGPPSSATKVSLLPGLSEVKQVKGELKRLWFAWRDRYEDAQRLLALSNDEVAALTSSQRLDLRALHAFREAQRKHSTALPSETQFQDELLSQGKEVALSYRETSLRFFPDVTAIKAAFHLCLATTGWNPTTLLDLDVLQEIFRTHPLDEKRYVMTGIKRRGGGHEQRCDGLKKSQSGPYAIIQFLIDSCKPLRDRLQARVAAIDDSLAAPVRDDLAKSDILALSQERLELLSAARSPWVYLAGSQSGRNAAFDGIARLSNDNSGIGKGGVQFVQNVIDSLNVKQPSRPIGRMTATDFRDAYALHWFQFSGGDILTVMRALQHRSISTSVTYTNNVVVRVRNRARARKVARIWWGEIEEHGHADATIVSFAIVHGKPSNEQRQRLGDLRRFMLTRLGVRCADPHNPPQHVAPNFEADGKKLCEVHRCTLCLENAILTEESVDGLARRLAELHHLQRTTSVAAWESSKFIEEIENTEIALGGYDPLEVDASIESWAMKISSGEHLVMPFESS